MTIEEIGNLFKKNREVLDTPILQIGDELEEIFQAVATALLSDEYKSQDSQKNNGQEPELTIEQREEISQLDALLFGVVSEQSYLEWLLSHRIEKEDILFKEYFNKGTYSFYLRQWRQDATKTKTTKEQPNS